MSEVLRTTSESPTFQVLLVPVTLLLQVLDALLQQPHQLKCFPRHDGSSLEGYLTSQEASIIVLTTQHPGLHKTRHLNLVVGVGKSPIPGTDCIRKPQVLPVR